MFKLFSEFLVSVLIFSSSMKNPHSSFIHSRCHKNEVSKTWLIYDKHPGCISELKGALGHLQISYDLRYPNYKSDPSLVKSDLCDQYHVIIVSDAISLVEYVLSAFLEGQCQYTRLILNVANRFDYSKEKNHNYHHMIRKLGSLDNVFWALNNNFENHWIIVKNIYNFIIPNHIFICEPFGYYKRTSPEEWPKLYENKSVFIYDRSLFFQRYVKNFNNYFLFHSKVQVFSDRLRHGGPDHLAAKFQWHIFIPYQFSLLKFFEYIRAGIVMVVPSPRLWKALILEMKHKNVGEYIVSMAYDLITVYNENDWEQYFQPYNNKYKNMLIQFDSWETLRNWTKNGLPFDLQRIRQQNSEILKKHIQEVEYSWENLLAVMGVDDNQHYWLVPLSTNI